MAFTGMLCLQIYHGLFLTAFTKNSRIARVELNCERSLKLSEGEAGIVNVEGCGMHWYLS